MLFEEETAQKGFKMWKFVRVLNWSKSIFNCSLELGHFWLCCFVVSNANDGDLISLDWGQSEQRGKGWLFAFVANYYQWNPKHDRKLSHKTVKKLDLYNLKFLNEGKGSLKKIGSKKHLKISKKKKKSKEETLEMENKCRKLMKGKVEKA